MWTRFRRQARLLPLLAVVACLGGADIAAAQGLFGSIFEALSGRRPPVRIAPPTAYADPNTTIDPGWAFGRRADPESSISSGGRSASFCVRTCDGRYFPIQAGGAEMCNAMCPASPTMAFYGGSISHAVASNGMRYSSLDTAFLYRQKIVAGCTCNGKDAFGLARVNLADDPTLREGDIVATSNGLMAYNTRSRRGNETAGFTPIDGSRLSREMRERLANTKIAESHTLPLAETSGSRLSAGANAFKK